MDQARKFNEFFSSAKTGSPRVLTCSEEPFETGKVDWPEIAPRTDVPMRLQETSIGKQAMKGYPALKGVTRKYWVNCAAPDDDPTAFSRTREIIKDMPEGYNNIAWSLIKDGDEHFFMAATAFI